MKLSIKKSDLYFYSTVVFAAVLIIEFFQLNQILKSNVSGVLQGEKRVIKCEVLLNNEMVQNVYYVAENLQEAKQQLFNSKNGLFFDNSLYIKTTDFKGNNHVIAFKDIHCDAVGTQVLLTENSP